MDFKTADDEIIHIHYEHLQDKVKYFTMATNC